MKPQMKSQVIPLRRPSPEIQRLPASASPAREALSLTDQEVLGFQKLADLSNGHAYHELPAALAGLPGEMAQLWQQAARLTPLEWEQQFIHSFAALSKVESLKRLAFCRPCPTASNSIDLSAALLLRRGCRTGLVEPTFDNLALLLKRRGVPLQPIAEQLIFDGSQQQLQAWLETSKVDALFLVSPSNPSGRCFTPERLSMIAELCAHLGVVVVMDASFRLFNRELFDDVGILLRSKVSFVGFEDTGKTFPTLDTKASLIYSSADLADELAELYNEVYLCCSGLSLALLQRTFELTREAGLDNVLWSLVDQRRARLRAALPGTGLYVAQESLHSVIGLEWLAFEAEDVSDIEVCAWLEELGLAALSGRQFYWASAHQAQHQRRIRLSMMKAAARFDAALHILHQARNNHGIFAQFTRTDAAKRYASS